MIPPSLKKTPAAAEFANEQLAELGPVRGREAVVGAVFVGLIGFWVLSSYVSWLSPTLVALLGIAVLFTTQALTWDSALSERSAWDIFVWYGGLLMMGGVLNDTGVATLFAEWFGSWFTGVHWAVVFVATLVIYFYAHYFFASTTVHALAMYPPFLALLVGVGGAGPGGRLQPRVHQQPDGGADPLRDDHIADHLRRGVRQPEGLVAGRVPRVGGEPRDLDPGGGCCGGRYSDCGDARGQDGPRRRAGRAGGRGQRRARGGGAPQTPGEVGRRDGAPKR